MTLLVAWLGVDTHGPTSAYITSDSRICWGSAANFDYTRKVFAFKNSPDILGYSGDVLFPSIVISQIIEMADCGILFSPTSSSKVKYEAIMKTLIHSFKNYPSDMDQITNSKIQLIYISREYSDNKEFFCHFIEWERGIGWKGEQVSLPEKSNVLFVLGSGKNEFEKNYKKYQIEGNSNTSRNVFHCFCDTLFSAINKTWGGAPQLVGIYRKPYSNSINFGIIRSGKRYFLGAQVDNGVNFDKIEWRNDQFELCDGYSMKKMESAQSQPNNIKNY